VPGLRAANLALRFFLELAALAGLAYTGLRLGRPPLLNWALAIGLPAAAAALWSRFAAPTSTHRLRGASLVLFELFIFGSATIGLLLAGQPVLAPLLALTYAINRVLITAWRQAG
jgi:hypothetical protein